MLSALASTDDLAARGITVPDGMDAATILASASAAIRDAAGCPITQTESTVTLIADDYCQLVLPSGPVQSVATVTVAGTVLTGWTKIGDLILMPICPRWTDTLPVEVVVTYTHGYPVIPEDIVDLCCSMTAMAFAQTGDYAGSGRRTSIKLGDYTETFTHPAGTESASPVAIPDGVRQQLRARFGAAVATIAMH